VLIFFFWWGVEGYVFTRRNYSGDVWVGVFAFKRNKHNLRFYWVCMQKSVLNHLARDCTGNPMLTSL
jgi:hypothetical protein